MLKKYIKDALLFIVATLPSFISALSQSSIVETIYFKSNSFVINKKYEHSLNNIASKLSSDTLVFLKIFGFTDSKGSADYNDKLAEKRAHAVYAYLASHSKFDTAKVYITWLGESNEIYDLHFPSAHKQKRCVDIWIQFYRKKPDTPK